MGFWDKVKDQVKKDFEKSAGVRLEYLGGHPRISAKTVNIYRSKGVLVMNDIELNVKEIEWDKQGTRSAGKAAAGAIVGGLLTGGVGAIAGAALGGRKKDDSLAVMTIEENGTEFTLYFKCDQKEYNQLVALIY